MPPTDEEFDQAIDVFARRYLTNVAQELAEIDYEQIDENKPALIDYVESDLDVPELAFEGLFDSVREAALVKLGLSILEPGALLAALIDAKREESLACDAYLETSSGLSICHICRRPKSEHQGGST